MLVTRRAKVHLLILLILLFSVAALPQRRANQKNARRARAGLGKTAAAGADTEMNMELSCQVYCSQTKLGTAVAELVWKVSETELSPMAFGTRLREQELEVTVFKEGFSQGLFANLFSIERHPSFRKSRTNDANRDEVPGLERLVVVGIGRLEDDSKSGAADEKRFRVESLGARPFSNENAEAVVIKIEGLEPGLNYFWRVPSTFRGRRVVSEIVQCKAPVCPSDSRSEQEETP